jgi:hypothetical protein
MPLLQHLPINMENDRQSLSLSPGWQLPVQFVGIGISVTTHSPACSRTDQCTQALLRGLPAIACFPLKRFMPKTTDPASASCSEHVMVTLTGQCALPAFLPAFHCLARAHKDTSTGSASAPHGCSVTATVSSCPCVVPTYTSRASGSTATHDKLWPFMECPPSSCPLQ